MLIDEWMDLEFERWFGDRGRRRKMCGGGAVVRLINL